jgi:hypothetical protein
MTGPPGVTISLTEAQGFTALGQFLQAICTPYPLTVVRAVGSTAPGSNVRVPEPLAGDFIIMSSLRTERLETNETTFSDNVSVGSITGTTLTVTEITRGLLAPGQLLIDYDYPNGNIAVNTTIVAQLTSTEPAGALGGTGTYQVSTSQTLVSETLYSGTRADQVGTEWVVQIDCHGPNSLNNINTIDTLFRSEYGVDFFAATGFWIAPLHVDTAGQMPFENAEKEMEWRWVMEAHLEIVPIVTTPQQFAQEVQIRNVVAAAVYAEGGIATGGTPAEP